MRGDRLGGKVRLQSCAGALLLYSVLGTSACGGARDAYDRVVMVSVSSLRGDHLGLNAYPRATTPFLDELAAGGAVFDRAYAASSRGALSLATLLTGLEVREHGLWDPAGSIGAEIPTLAGQLAERGYETAAFVSYWSYFEPRGLARGFAHFDSPPELAEHSYRAADRTVDAALAWLEQRNSGEPLFLFLQLHDPTRLVHLDIQAARRHVQLLRCGAALRRQRAASSPRWAADPRMAGSNPLRGDEQPRHRSGKSLLGYRRAGPLRRAGARSVDRRGRRR
jgi:hypothetical protein